MHIVSYTHGGFIILITDCFDYSRVIQKIYSNDCIHSGAIERLLRILQGRAFSSEVTLCNSYL